MTTLAKLEWILLVAQLPASASTARVALWRRLRAAGATSVEHGAWMLPARDDHRELMSELADTVRKNGGSASLFDAYAQGDDTEMIARFAADRAREYQEFATRSQGLLDEIAKEIASEKFTFAELEEIEDDLKKLNVWLAKIAARDFFADGAQAKANGYLAQCRNAVEQFGTRVFEVEGLQPQ